ncbi:mucin-2-like [Paramacrobiotus metropolitanus]|uniref:mucin-2-like n=1 Tax=Paramacrobiotus metropolitanus TaxID=2943436 RepID=UPI0024458782|nr:mucin-2-like [Paramacrobiotus metropolitanus]
MSTNVEYSSKTTLIEKDHHHKSQNAFWCKICGVVAVLMTILAVVFIALYAVEATRKHHHHTTPIFIPTTMNPNETTTLSPNMTTPFFNTTFNPNITTSLPFNTTFNPNMTTPFNTTFNPNVTTSMPLNTTFNPNMTTAEPMNMTTTHFLPNVTTVTPNVTMPARVTTETPMVPSVTTGATTKRIEVEVTEPVVETNPTLDPNQWPTLPHGTHGPLVSLRPHRRTTTDGPWNHGIAKRSLKLKEKVPKKEHEHKPESVLLGAKF